MNTTKLLETEIRFVEDGGEYFTRIPDVNVVSCNLEIKPQHNFCDRLSEKGGRKRESLRRA